MKTWSLRHAKQSRVTVQIPPSNETPPHGRELARLRRSGQGDGLSKSRGVLRDTGPVVRFAARAQQPATLNEVIEATTSEFGRKRTCRLRCAMSALTVNAEKLFSP